jgi:hypothetical protein
VTDAAILPLIEINTIGGDPVDQYMKKKKQDTFSERGESRMRRPACDTLPGPTCESESEEGYFQ